MLRALRLAPELLAQRHVAAETQMPPNSKYSNAVVLDLNRREEQSLGRDSTFGLGSQIDLEAGASFISTLRFAWSGLDRSARH